MSALLPVASSELTLHRCRLNLLGQVAGVASTAFGLAQMIFAAVSRSSFFFQGTS